MQTDETSQSFAAAAISFAVELPGSGARPHHYRILALLAGRWSSTSMTAPFMRGLIRQTSALTKSTTGLPRESRSREAQPLQIARISRELPLEEHGLRPLLAYRLWHYSRTF
jgi:hypothetical protein